MENASKALLIASGVLIIILIVTIGIKILNPVEGVKQSATEVGQSISDKTSSAISTILGIEERIPETPVDYFEFDGTGLILSSVGKQAIEDGKLTKINIPSNVGGKQVTRIGKKAFFGCNQITKVIIPEGVTNINDSAFSSCTNLVEIKFPNTLKSIGYCSFQSCKSITKLIIPEGVTNLNGYTFAYCSNLTEIKLPSTLTSLWDYVFAGVGNASKGIELIEIPNGITQIDQRAFNGANIKKVVIPGSVKLILSCAFQSSAVEEIEIKGNNLTLISTQAFYNCTKLNKINLPESLEEIGTNAFRCTNLKEIRIPASVTNIRDYAFLECTSLEKVTIDGNPTMGNNVFPSQITDK